MNKKFVFLYFLAFIFGVILLVDTYHPKCAGASCKYIPIIPWAGNCTCDVNAGCAPGWPYSVHDDGSNSSNLYLNCQEMQVSATKLNNSIMFLRQIKFRDVSAGGNGGVCTVETAYNSGMYYYFWRVYTNGEDNNDKTDCGAVIIDWDNDYGV